MLARDNSASPGCILEQLLPGHFQFVFYLININRHHPPIFIFSLHQMSVDIAVASMAENRQPQAIFLSNFVNFPDMPGYFRAGHTRIQDVNGLLFYSFINLRANLQHLILFSRRISHKNIQGSIFKHNISYLVCHFPQIIFRASINNDHEVHVS